MLHGDLVKSEKRLGTILSGSSTFKLYDKECRYLFVTQNSCNRQRFQGTCSRRYACTPVRRLCVEKSWYAPLANNINTFANGVPEDRQESQQLGFTYVQGMNVLAAPFLYTLPSELEAFFCFSKFIEESCPLYVQPTLEGVHRGLKVRMFIVHSITRCSNFG